MVSLPKLSMSTRVRYDKYNPNSKQATDARKSIAHLDYSPLPRVTMQSFFMGVLISMGGFIFGYDTGQISGFLEMPDFLMRFGQRNAQTGKYAFSNVRSGLIVAMLSIGTLIGALVAAPIADKIGRRLSVSFWSVVFAVGLIIQISASQHWYQVMIGRWVAGLGVGALSLLVPMYQAETAPVHIRGALISTYQLFITLGIFLAACFNFANYEHQRKSSASWRIPIGIGFAWALILGLGILLFPESTRYDYRKGQTERATRTLTKVYGAPESHFAVHRELEDIEAKLRAESVKQSGFKEWINMWKAPKMFYRIVLGMTLQMFQQLTGANYFFYYGTVIFKATGINNSFVTQMILNGINFGVTFIGLYNVEHFGRRKSLIFGSVWMTVCFLIFASVGHFALDVKKPSNTPNEGTVLIVFACLFILGFATTWGPMVWTITGELFPSRYRAKGMALSTASNWLWNFLLAFFTPFITGDIDFLYGYVFAGCNVAAGLIVYFFVMEGQGRSLEELDTMYLLGIKPWQSAEWEAPSAEEISKIRKEAGTDDTAMEDGTFAEDKTVIGSDDGEKTAEHRE